MKDKDFIPERGVLDKLKLQQQEASREKYKKTPTPQN